jgi:predicted DNA-binding transcriptional regulator YafY
MHKYIGQVIEIIYLAQSGKFSQRKIEVLAIQGETVKAYCLQCRALRIFRMDSILAVQQMRGVNCG